MSTFEIRDGLDAKISRAMGLRERVEFFQNPLLAITYV